MDALLLIIPGLSVFCLLMGIYKLYFERKWYAREAIQAALQPYRPTDNTSVNLSAPLLKRHNENGNSLLYRLEVQLERANWAIKPEEFLLCACGLGVLNTALFTLLGTPLLLALLIGVTCYGLSFSFLKLKIWLRMRKAEQQFSSVMDFMVNCFKTGFGFSRCIQMVARNFEDPWGTEFGRMAVELNLGATIEETLANLKRRIPSIDVELFSSAVLIQKETGGNLAEILGNLGQTCRDRFKLYRRVRAITAQGKLSATIVSCVPFFLMGVIYLFLPEPVSAFVVHPIGITLLTVALLWMLAGIFILYKLVQIEV